MRSTITLCRAGMAMAIALFSLNAQAADTDQTREFVDLMSRYMSLVDQVVAATSSEEASVFLAIEGIYEVYEKRKDAPGAIAHFERLLDQHGDHRVIRTMLRLKIADIHKETGEADKVLEQLDLIITETLR